MVMPANNGKWQVHYWQGRYGGLGHLYSPGGARGPWPHLPYALDNGAYPAFTSGKPWDEAAWLRHVDYYLAAALPPRWLLVPDVVQDRGATLDRWRHYEPWLRCNRDLSRCALALAVQDGMEPADVPAGVDVVFVGGSTDWKWATVRAWCAAFPRVHVGRVNGYRGLRICADAGAESCDGTGWFRGDQAQLAGLERFLTEQAFPDPTL